MSRKTKTPECPKYKAKKVVPIVYGMPSTEMLEKSNRDEVALGGCVVMDGQPKWFCNACDHEFK
jgi:hypothetical protein